jgi:hypothetical protein
MFIISLHGTVIIGWMMDKKCNTEWKNNKYQSISPWCAKSADYKDQLHISGGPIIGYMDQKIHD